jgi:hypothetical protein
VFLAADRPLLAAAFQFLLTTCIGTRFSLWRGKHGAAFVFTAVRDEGLVFET